MHPEKTCDENHYDHYADDIKDVHRFPPIVLMEAEAGRANALARVMGRKSEALARLRKNNGSFCFRHRSI
jgi:hypothetical protein